VPVCRDEHILNDLDGINRQLTPMPVTIEFYGIARERVGRDQIDVEGNSLGEVMSELGEQFPEFSRDCLSTNDNKPGVKTLNRLFIASLGKDRFIRDPQTPLVDGDCLLILSVDAGG
jgi:molybdopterin converting factor small subunit